MGWLHVTILTSALLGQAPATSTPADSPAPPTAPAAADARSSADERQTQGDGKPGATRKPVKAGATREPVKSGAADPARKPDPAAPAPTRKPAPGPRVMTRSEMQKPRSPFLDMPGEQGAPADRYGAGTPDWREIPPWRQTSFFGIRAPGKFFVYVIDCSESMIDEDRFARATIEVRRSVLALQAPQQFEVIFYNQDAIPMPGGPMPRAADPRNKSQLVSWLRIIDPIGGTDPRAAIRQALMLRPEAVFLLSDGAFPPGTAASVARFNAHKIPIHCIDLSGGEGGDSLRKIAKDSGGQYAARAGNLQGKP